MPYISESGARVNPIPPGLIARAGEAVRHVISGVAPATWFGPVQPVAPESVAGRAFDYSVGYNLQYQPRADEPGSFAQLHTLADNCDLLRIVIETRKDQIEGQDRDVRPPRAGQIFPPGTVCVDAPTCCRRP